ncbi:MAG: tryptophan synthase subunit alpha [Bacillota bacterium]
MNRLGNVFAGKKAFIPFITAGDPSISVTERLIISMAEAGADLIEIGIPFSDPVAEGKAIQDANVRALAGGTTTDGVFSMVRRVREKCGVPLAFMTYANPIFAYGTDKFMLNCREASVDAIIVPDLPFEEKGELKPACDKYGIALISMVAPTSAGRIRMIVSEAEGFIYCVSSMGVTGVREQIGSFAEDIVKLVKEVKNIPCAVGFGISTPAQAAEAAVYADGVIVGSAIVEIVGQHGEKCVPYVAEYVRKMKEAVSGRNT